MRILFILFLSLIPIVSNADNKESWSEKLFRIEQSKEFKFEGMVEEKFLCLTEQSVGFKFSNKNKNYQPTNLDSKQKYIIKMETLPDTKASFVNVKEFEHDIYLFTGCDANHNAFDINCDGGLSGSFRFHKDSKRFIKTYHFGYVPETAAEGNDIFMEIGSCSKI